MRYAVQSFACIGLAAMHIEWCIVNINYGHVSMSVLVNEFPDYGSVKNLINLNS